MEKSSEVIQISSTISQERFDEILEEMVLEVENCLWISVEDGFEENSFWISTPLEDFDEYWPTPGIIEIDVNEDVFNKILSLTHEVGHYFLEKDTDLGEGSCKIFVESIAWYLGYKYFKNKGYVIDKEEYKKEWRDKVFQALFLTFLIHNFIKFTEKKMWTN